MDDAPLVFALEASRDFGAAVAARLGTTLGAHEERAFEDGEHKSRPLANVRGRAVFAIHSLFGEPGAGADEKLLRLLFFLGALRDAGAGRVTAVVPYLAYARKDQRSKSRDPVTTRYVARFFESVGCDEVVTLDVHNVAAFENAFRCRATNVPAAGPLVEHAVPLLGGGPVSVVSPDAGGIKRADRFRARLAARMGRPVASAFVEKYRSGGELRGGELVGEVRGTTAVVVDDLVSAGHTMQRAAAACRAAGAGRVLALATHGLFSPEADAALADGAIDRIVVTDTIPRSRLANPAVLSRLERVSVVPLVAAIIARLHEGGDVEALTP